MLLGLAGMTNRKGKQLQISIGDFIYSLIYWLDIGDSIKYSIDLSWS